MIGANIKSLIGRLNPLSTRLLDQAAGFCLTRTNYQVTIEHFLLKCIEDGSGDVIPILRHFEVDVPEFERQMLATVEEFASGNTGRPGFSQDFLNLLEETWVIASINLEDTRIRTGHILLTLLRQTGFLSARNYGITLSRINFDELVKEFYQATKESVEVRPIVRSAAGAVPAGAPQDGEDYLTAYCRDVTQEAKDGKIDPVFGRNREIREMIDILARRRKNNPIAVGEPGVGKTAVVEGLALRIAQGDVPDVLKGVRLLSLDMGLLQAGAGVKGEFEKRLKGVIEAVKASEIPVVMFIDEAHTIIGAGGQTGGSDAANLLKPALARGELRTVAATTWSEYKKYFEKDAALARRFQLVKLDEPSIQTTIDILRGLKDIYEKSHGVRILDQGIVDSVRLSARYVAGRQLPDKAFDLLDTACARVKVSLRSTPAVLDDTNRTIDSLERTIASLGRERHLGEAEQEELDKAKKQLSDLQEKQKELNERWEKENALIEKVFKAIEDKDGDAEDAARAELAAIQESEPLVIYEVGSNAVAEVVTDWTGIPLSKMLTDEAEKVLKLDKIMCDRIKGQDWAVETVAQGIRSAKSGVKPAETPMGVFLLVGPSGVGKTETGITLADELFGGERFLTTINMSEFQEKHTVSRLIGSPPGYVGYGEGGRLTEALRQKPYSVVLLDETEKAHPDVLNLFYQVFDKGMLSDGEGRQIDCRNALFILTSNLGTDTITKMCSAPVRPEVSEVFDAVRPELSKWFKPALLARMNIVPYMILDEDTIKEITVLKLKKLARRLMENHRLRLEYSDEVLDEVAARCTEVETGARNIDYILSQNIMPKISTEILQAMAKGFKPKTLTLGYETEEGFTFKFDQGLSD